MSLNSQPGGDKIARPCTICTHSKCSQIESALLKKTISRDSFEAIAKRFGVTESSLIRHLEKHVSKDIPAVTVQKEVVPKDISQVINESLAELEWAKQRAKEKDDIRAFTDTVKAKFNFSIKLFESRDKVHLISDYQHLLSVYQERDLEFLRLQHVIHLLSLLPNGNFMVQFLDLIEQEECSQRNADFYYNKGDQIRQIQKQFSEDKNQAQLKINEYTLSLEANNPIFQALINKDDVFDLLKIMIIIQIQNENQHLFKKVRKNKLTSDDLPEALEVVKKIEAIDPGGKIRKKFKESLDKEDES